MIIDMLVEYSDDQARDDKGEWSVSGVEETRPQALGSRSVKTTTYSRPNGDKMTVLHSKINHQVSTKFEGPGKATSIKTFGGKKSADDYLRTQHGLTHKF